MMMKPVMIKTKTERIQLIRPIINVKRTVQLMLN